MSTDQINENNLDLETQNQVEISNPPEQIDPYFKTNYRGEVRCFDPWRVQRILFRFPGLKFPETITLAEEEGDEDAMAIVMDAVSTAFNIPKFDSATGEGLLENEAFRLLDEFVVYALKVKKNTEALQDSQPSMEQES